MTENQTLMRGLVACMLAGLAVASLTLVLSREADESAQLDDEPAWSDDEAALVTVSERGTTMGRQSMGHQSRSTKRRTEEQAWLPSPSSPLALLPLSEAMKYRGTEESLRAFMARVPEYQNLELNWTPDIEVIWSLCQEQLALRRFVTEYHKRVFANWREYRDTEALVVQLAPVSEFMRDRIAEGDADGVWRLIADYTFQLHAKIIEEGDTNAAKAVEARWPLHRQLVEAQSAAFHALELLLKEGTE